MVKTNNLPSNHYRRSEKLRRRCLLGLQSCRSPYNVSRSTNFPYRGMHGVFTSRPGFAATLYSGYHSSICKPNPSCTHVRPSADDFFQEGHQETSPPDSGPLIPAGPPKFRTH